MEPRAGDRITSNLQLRRHLGAGGMGHVWVAWHAGLHTEVVVKLIAGDLVADEAMVARFSREAAAAAQVRSPHVVQIFDHGVTADGQPYIAMEKLEGESLGARIERARVVPPSELVQIVSQCAKALVRAHERGVVHRDIKPDNIFLTDLGGGEVFTKVLDFGIAKADIGPGAATTTGAVLGSPFYMSPEQVLGKRIDFRTDLWSLGVLTYEALLGVRPFQADTIGALSIRICQEALPVPTALQPLVPPAFDEWFLRACAREPVRRFESARAMAESLAAALVDAPAELPPVDPLALAQTEPFGATTSVGITTPPMPRPGRGWRRWALAGGLTAAGGAAGVLVWGLASSSAPSVVGGEPTQYPAGRLAPTVPLEAPAPQETQAQAASATSTPTPASKSAGHKAVPPPPASSSAAQPITAPTVSASIKPPAVIPKPKDEHDPTIF